jgi:predicted nucleic acid-binding protein
VILLDTSAVLAHAYRENGAEIVAATIAREEAWIAAPTWLELRIHLATEEGGSEMLDEYRTLVRGITPVTVEVADAAFQLRQAVKRRIPSMDALVAASAIVRGFSLLHRDAHFAAIPQELLSHASLPPKS